MIDNSELARVRAALEASQRTAARVVEERDILRLQVNGAISAALGSGGCVVPSLGDVALLRVEKERDEAVRTRDAVVARFNDLLEYARVRGAVFDDNAAGLRWIEAAISSAIETHRALKLAGLK